MADDHLERAGQVGADDRDRAACFSRAADSAAPWGALYVAFPAHLREQYFALGLLTRCSQPSRWHTGSSGFSFEGAGCGSSPRRARRPDGTQGF